MTVRCDNDACWYHEASDGKEKVAFRCTGIVHQGQSRYHQIDIIDTSVHGRMLFLDGVTQSSEMDEFIYHEMLVHPGLCSHPDPRSVLVIGGAEGATLREICRHSSVRRVVMVDVDEELIHICRKHLWRWHRGSFDDPRVELIIGDGRQYLEGTTECFDVIILDLSDPVTDSPAVFLFTQEFYRLVDERLDSKGYACIQGESTSPQEGRLHVRIVKTLETVFPAVWPYRYFMPSFHRPDGHILVTRDIRWSPESLAAQLEVADMPLKYLSPEMARAAFALPPYLREAYLACQDIITDRRPCSERSAKPVVHV